MSFPASSPDPSFLSKSSSKQDSLLCRESVRSGVCHTLSLCLYAGASVAGKNRRNIMSALSTHSPNSAWSEISSLGSPSLSLLHCHTAAF